MMEMDRHWPGHTQVVISLLMSDSTIETISPAIRYFVHSTIEQLTPPGIKYPARAKSI